MASLTNIEIINKLKPIESKIKAKNTFYREDIQLALNAIWGQGLSPDKKKEILSAMIGRTGVKIERSFYSSRIQNYEYGDRTYAFLDDLDTYRGIRERQ